MSQRTSYRQGTPNWADLQTTDQPAAKAFYAELFGWNYDDQPMDENATYSMASLGGSAVAGIASQSPDMVAGGAPSTWNTYLAVDDVDAAADRVTSAGGQVLMPPFDVMEAGRMGFIADPTGAQVILWQAKEHIGSGVVNEPGAVIWNELVTDDKNSALAFYAEALGIGSLHTELGDTAYTGLTVDGDMVGGTAQAREGEANHWLVYFNVDDTEQAAEHAVELGATVVDKPIETPIGVFAVLHDPQGAVFGLFSKAG